MTMPQSLKDYFEILKTIGAFAGLGGLLKWLFKLYLNRLTRREKELLVAALQGDNSIIVFKAPGMGIQWIRAGNLDLGAKTIPNVEFIDALDKLVARRHLRWVSDNCYCLSGSGFKLARILERSIPASSIPCEQNSAAEQATLSPPL